MRRVIWIAALLTLCLSLPAGAAAGSEKKNEDDSSRLKAETFKGLELRGIGPALMSGRIADIAIHPKDASTWYVAVGSGGIWKTTNAGTSWKPIFDDQASYSIGCLALDPSHPEIVWAGTGENVGGRHVGFGDGVYRSPDGGDSWENVGLRDSEHIGKILVDPRDSNVVVVASQGPLWSPGGERGLFRTTDAGGHWEKVLGGGEYTGVNDVVADPRDPDVLYASTHQRFRNVAALIDGGPESGIHKSTDGGLTFRKLKSGLPEEDMGKIGLAVSPQRPDVVYAVIELGRRKGGVWRSANGGASWEKRSDYVAGGTGPHYYQEVFASPHRFDRIYHMDVRLHVSEDGGKSFTSIEGKHKHVDNHALAFDPNDPDYLLAGCDGGVYQSWDLGRTWKFVSNLSDWQVVIFADGHQPAVDPTNPDIVYGEWQQGNLIRHDRRTGENVYIQPQPGPDEPWDRFNWDSPILISPHDPKRLFYASQRVWRSDDRGDSWRAISGDLTRNLDRLKLPMMGRVWSLDAAWDLLAMSKYGTVTSLAQSPVDEQLIYAGTDDGLLQVTEDSGATWRKIDRLPGVPEFFFVNDVKADLHDADTVYVAVDDHKAGDFKPYLLKSSDRGRSWKSMTGDLPDRHLVWRIVQDHERPELFFLGTEFGVFFTVDAGKRWVELEGGAPNIPFRDLAIQRRENDLVGATFGRSFWVLDDYSPLRHVTEASLEQEADLFPVRKTWWYVERRPLGGNGKASQGTGFFVAPNPPFGAVFTYYLRDDIKTRKQERRKREKEIAKEGGDTPYPGWDAMRLEQHEEDPAILLTVRDASGEVVRHLTGPVDSGIHRVAWDLRRPSHAPWGQGAGDAWEQRRNRGVLASPGTYTVSLAKRVDGVVTDLGLGQRFEVVPMREGTLSGASPEAAAAFLAELSGVQRATDGARAAIDDTLKRLGGIKEVLDRSTVDDPSLHHEARALERRLHALRERLSGDRQRGRMGDPGPVSIARRVEVASMGTRSSTYGPTPTHRMSLDIARESFADLRRDLDRLIGEELPALEHQLDAAGVPWTPGRTAPAGG